MKERIYLTWEDRNYPYFTQLEEQIKGLSENSQVEIINQRFNQDPIFNKDPFAKRKIFTLEELKAFLPDIKKERSAISSDRFSIDQSSTDIINMMKEGTISINTLQQLTGLLDPEYDLNLIFKNNVKKVRDVLKKFCKMIKSKYTLDDVNIINTYNEFYKKLCINLTDCAKFDIMPKLQEKEEVKLKKEEEELKKEEKELKKEESEEEKEEEEKLIKEEKEGEEGSEEEKEEKLIKEEKEGEERSEEEKVVKTPNYKDKIITILAIILCVIFLFVATLFVAGLCIYFIVFCVLLYKFRKTKKWWKLLFWPRYITYIKS